MNAHLCYPVNDVLVLQWITFTTLKVSSIRDKGQTVTGQQDQQHDHDQHRPQAEPEPPAFWCGLSSHDLFGLIQADFMGFDVVR
jgi:hypothetical protein